MLEVLRLGILSLCYTKNSDSFNPILFNMAKDIFHDTVKKALEKDGWKITHDPYRLRYGIADVYIDLAAEEAIAAEKEGLKIAVEVKSFLSASNVSEFHTALGQFLNYRIAIETSDEPETSTLPSHT